MVAAWAPFATSLPNDYVYDDIVFVADKTALVEGPLADLFTQDFLYPHRLSGLYRPVTALSYALPLRLGLTGALAQRALNLLLHLGVGILLLGVMTRLGIPKAPSLCATLWFLCHPVHSEAVALVSGRSELLSALGVLGALLVLVPRDSEARPPFTLILLGFLFSILAALSKEAAFVFPALLGVVCLTRWRVQSSSFLSIIGFTTGFCLLFLLRSQVVSPVPTEGFQVENPVGSLSFLDRIPTALAGLGLHVQLLILPIRLSADYSAHAFPVAESLLDPRSLLGIGCLVGWVSGTTLCLIRWKGRSSTSSKILGLCLFLAPLLPVLNLLFPIGTLFAERHSYLPSAGIAILIATCISGLRREEESQAKRSLRMLRPVSLALFVLVLGTFTLRSVCRNSELASEATFYRGLVKTQGESAKAHWLLANYLQGRGEFPEARLEAKRALSIEHRFPEALYGLAYIEYALGNKEASREAASDCIQIAPGHASSHSLLGILAFEAGKRRESIAFFETALSLEPDLAGVRGNLEAARQLPR